MSLIDRSFEEVCAIMDHTGDVVDLHVEHATDFRMCDLLDEHLQQGACGYSGQTPSGSPRKSGDGPAGLGLIQGKLTINFNTTQEKPTPFNKFNFLLWNFGIALYEHNA